MHGKVMDASALGAILFVEPRADEAERLMGDDLYEPALLAFELASVALKKLHRKRGPQAVVIGQLNAVFDMNIAWVDVNVADVVSLALATGLTAYDASYLHVARVLDLPLVTFDRELEEAARRP